MKTLHRSGRGNEALNPGKAGQPRFDQSLVTLAATGLRAGPLLLLSAGCSAAGPHSPSVDVLGSYFPAWMACILLGLAITLVVRQVLIGLRLNVHLRPAGLVYVCMMVVWTLAVWLVRFKN